jgi:hypothetical protein
MKLRLGKHPPKHDPRTLRFAKYSANTAEKLPAKVDYTKPVRSWPMMQNDKYPLCACAAAGHMIQQWTAETGDMIVLSDEQVLAAYRHFAGDNLEAGAHMLDVLKHWRRSGIGDHKVDGFTQLDLQNLDQVKEAVWLFGNCYVGLALPDHIAHASDPRRVPWVISESANGEFAPNLHNGHCVPIVGYDPEHLYIVTWGALISMSWEFCAIYMDEAYAVLSPDWISRMSGEAPSGFDLAALETDLKRITDCRPAPP